MILDIDKLRTPNNYSSKIGKNRSWVYQLIKDGKLESVKIDGVLFVIDEKEKPREEPTTKK